MFGVDDVALAMGAGSVMDIVGGQLSAAQNRQTQRYNTDVAREFAQNSVKWRVQDANRAGIHPLAALGMMPSSAPATVIGDTTAQSFSDAGQSLTNAARMQGTQSERDRQTLENKLLGSQIEETDARRDQIRSEIARANAPGVGVGIQSEIPGLPAGQAPVTPGVGVIDINPSPVTSASSARPSMEAGVRPGEEQRLIDGIPWILPQLGGESAEEIISEMSPAAWVGLLLRNKEAFGDGWLTAALKNRYLGQRSPFHIPTIQEQQRMGSMR